MNLLAMWRVDNLKELDVTRNLGFWLLLAFVMCLAVAGIGYWMDKR